MQVKIINDNFINGNWPSPKRGEVRNVDAEFGRHLVEAGVAIELKLEQPVEKKQKPSSASRADPHSQRPTSKSRAKKSTKPSPSTTIGD